MVFQTQIPICIRIIYHSLLFLHPGVSIGFNETVYPVDESAGVTSICVDLIGISQRSVQVTLSRADLESQDFQLPETTLVFVNGPSQICRPIVITSDVVVEGQESFMLEVSTSDPAVDYLRIRTLLTIIDDDSKSPD